MPTRLEYKAEVERLTGLLEEKERELTETKQLLAQVAPDVATGELPEPITEYTEDLNKRVLAMFASGMTERRIIANLGCGLKRWGEWGRMFPAFAETLTRGRDLFVGYWDEQATNAITANNNRFPMQLYREMRAGAEASTDDVGDASGLVLIDLRDKASA
jgi:hypothetical protein